MKRNNLTPGNGEAETDRVRAATDPVINQRIDDKTEQCLRFYSVQPSDTISDRIRQLDEEWDMERYLLVNASTIALTGVVLGALRNKTWLLLPTTVMSFLLMHALQGWCPPVPVLRKAGIRTRREIDAEKYALKFLRGDFDELKEVYETTVKAVEAYKACMR
jgi:hypothetical protein